jgi:hypothetical protein
MEYQFLDCFDLEVIPVSNLFNNDLKKLLIEARLDLVDSDLLLENARPGADLPSGVYRFGLISFAPLHGAPSYITEEQLQNALNVDKTIILADLYMLLKYAKLHPGTFLNPIVAFAKSATGNEDKFVPVLRKGKIRGKEEPARRLDLEKRAGGWQFECRFLYSRRVG